MASEQTAGEYIKHHLQHLQYNFALEPVQQTKMIDFGIFNADSVFFSVVLGALACFVIHILFQKHIQCLVSFCFCPFL